MDVAEPVVLDEEFTRDPYALYAHLRAKGPVVRALLPSGAPVWLVTHYEYSRATLADQRLAKDPRALVAVQREWESGGGSEAFGPFDANMLNSHMLSSDPPDHTRLRKPVARAFTARRVAELRPRVQEIAEELIDDFPESGRTDFIDSFAFLLPVIVICELLGIPPQDRDDFRVWSTALVTTSTPAEAQRAATEMSAYLSGLLAAKRADPGSDLLSALLEARTEEERLSEAELISMAFLLLVAGHETTVNLIANGTLAMLLHPEQLAKLRSDPALIPAAVEEFLRFEGPVNNATARFTVEPTTIAGVTIPAGEIVLVSLGSADHDPAQYPDGDSVDITRDTSGHLAFGHGIHHCLGAPLARLEGCVAFETLFNRFESLELDTSTADLTWRPGQLLRGLHSLPIRYTLAPSSPSTPR